jgi:RNA polymerase sigma-70 factor (ECF subfamily)
MQGAARTSTQAGSARSADPADDEGALRRCRARDISGLGALVERYQLAAVRTAYLLVQDQSAAEDIVQESFLLVYRHAGRFRPGSPFAPWFYRIVLNAARQYLRGVRRRRETGLEHLDESSSARIPVASDPLRHAERAERRSAVVAILRSLTHKQREVLVLRYYAGYRDDEIAAILGSPAGTIRWRMHAALRAFERAARARAPWLIDEGPDDVRDPATLLAAADEGKV